MYKKALYSVGEGGALYATQNGGNVAVYTRENGRIVRRLVSVSGGKVFGARAVSYADGYFDFPFGTLEIIGDETLYAVKTGNNA